eukprot:NODE_1039_length_624_cov_132.500870_g967_i0.p3 GENE.NODE_1039_length_624_cov_132.500870_g967_i0~~NODE_1039_length_624_cov_132.500870_g967_i0.p3  ORF type:complete len:69 (+),score=18.68 NODE_1039_length_624_cov_132.500870_g967_i0:30-209(+)
MGFLLIVMLMHVTIYVHGCRLPHDTPEGRQSHMYAPQMAQPPRHTAKTSRYTHTHTHGC